MEPPPRDPEIDGFLALLATRRAPKTVDAYRRDLSALAAWLKGPVGRITTEQLEQYLAELRAAGLSPSTIARRVAAIRTFFRHQALLGVRTDNPAAELDLPRRRRTLPRTLSPAEAERLVEAANGTTPRALRDRALVELLYGAGLRVSEAVGLQKSSVDLDARIVRCIGKGSKERIVPIGRQAAQAPTRALPQCERRRAHARGRFPDPAQPGGQGRARTGKSPSALAPSLLRNASPRRRGRPTFRSGDARACRSRDDRAVHTRIRSASSRVVFPGAPPCAEKTEIGVNALRSEHRTSHRRHMWHRVPDDGRGTQQELTRAQATAARVPQLRSSNRRSRLSRLHRLTLRSRPLLQVRRHGPGGVSELCVLLVVL